MHVLPQLRKLERRYPTELQVVSVHSPKFPTERKTENLRRAVLRLRIEHPVVNDAEFLVWSLYSANAWPTMIFIDPNGDVIGRHAGEIDRDQPNPRLDQSPGQQAPLSHGVTAKPVTHLGFFTAQVKCRADRATGQQFHGLVVVDVQRIHHAGLIDVVPQAIKTFQQAPPLTKSANRLAVQLEIGNLEIPGIGVRPNSEGFQSRSQVGRTVESHTWQCHV